MQAAAKKGNANQSQLGHLALEVHAATAELEADEVIWR